MTAVKQARILDFDMLKPLISRRRGNTSSITTITNSDECVLELKALLQTTIELTEILDIFFQQTGQLLKLDGLDYQHTINQCEFSFGDNSGYAAHFKLQTQDDYLGELAFYRNKNKFTYRELKLIEEVIAALVYPLRNGLQYQQAIQAALTDPLTKAGNRMYMEDRLTLNLKQARRYGQPFSILMIDVDYFKKINDTYGHMAGDEVLKTLAQTMQSCSRCVDSTFRYGGEEFILLLDKTDTDGANIIAERLRAKVAKQPFMVDDLEIPVTVSIGIASLNLDDTENELDCAKDGLIKRADAALYEAKQQGRNRVIAAPAMLATTN